jgi:endonuclease-3
MNPRSKIRWIAERLRTRYGEISISPYEPVETLVRTILSQNTNDVNRDRAYRMLFDCFRSLEGVKDAPTEEIAQAIHIGGLHRQKAVRIKQVLKRIEKEQGTLDLSFLGMLSLEEALAWLLASPGVGKKTAGIVLLFSFGRPYFPVDTHIRRILVRVGVVEPTEDPHDRMNGMLPPDAEFMRALHLHLIRLGREICHPRHPVCVTCPLRKKCAWVKHHALEGGKI